MVSIFLFQGWPESNKGISQIVGLIFLDMENIHTKTDAKYSVCKWVGYHIHMTVPTVNKKLTASVM